MEIEEEWLQITLLFHWIRVYLHYFKFTSVTVIVQAHPVHWLSPSLLPQKKYHRLRPLLNSLVSSWPRVPSTMLNFVWKNLDSHALAACIKIWRFQACTNYNMWMTYILPLFAGSSAHFNMAATMEPRVQSFPSRAPKQPQYHFTMSWPGKGHNVLATLNDPRSKNMEARTVLSKLNPFVHELAQWAVGSHLLHWKGNGPFLLLVFAVKFFGGLLQITGSKAR